MIQHVVLWKLADDAQGRSKDEIITQMRVQLSLLPALIPEIRSLSVVRNENPTDKNMDVALITSFDSLEDLSVYVTHPEHVKVGEFIASVVCARSAIDYQVHT